MQFGYRSGTAATWLFILLISPALAKDKHPGHHHHRSHPATAATAPPPVDRADQLYSRHALHLARSVLQLRLLELREERLECVRRVVESRIGADPFSNSAPVADGTATCANATR